MTFEKEINKEMEKVMMLMDMGILPIEDKDGIDEIKVATEDELLADGNADFKKFLFRDNFYREVWEAFGEKYDIPGENHCFADEDYFAHMVIKNRRAERRRQNHKHKKVCVNGKTVKTYGKEGQTYLNNDERIACGKQLINGKFVDEVKEAEKFQNASNDTDLFSWLEFMEKFECEYSTLGDDTFVNPCSPWKRPNFSASIGEIVGALEWAKKFKEFLSLEEILDMFF